MDLIPYNQQSTLPAQNPSNTIKIPENVVIPPEAPNRYQKPYNKEIMSSIIYSIAAEPEKTIHQICEEHSMETTMFWFYLAISPALTSAYYSARQARTGGMIERQWEAGERIGHVIENIDLNSDTSALETRRQEARVRLLRVHSLNAQYETSRLNYYYRDKQEITHEMGAGAARAQAWELYQAELARQAQSGKGDDT